MNHRLLSALLLVCLQGLPALGQANGHLQLHFINVGQGDGAILISPGGETVLFDNGVRNDCDRVVAYLQQLGVTAIDYHVASHYHDDHIGCTVPVLREFPLRKTAYDRGGTYSTATFRHYTNSVAGKRKTAIEGAALTLDANSTHPVRVEFVALNGNGIQTLNENDLSLVSVVRFGQFDAVMGGDLSGYRSENYKDIETSVAAKVGQVEVYKVNHHGSRHSSNPHWLDTIRPRIGIISCGDGNSHGHPTRDCLARLHAMNIKTYWTERGNGTAPVDGRDIVGDDIIVEIGPGDTRFTVAYSGNKTNVHEVWNPLASTTRFAWSKRAEVYHFANCLYVDRISPTNLETNTAPPNGKSLHLGCPKIP
jgi:beta-lactamase superfamily II metal-dependent hydrolase